MNSITTTKISKTFGTRKVLNNISFTISPGEIFGLLGPSGAGKTTLIKILTGQLPYEGTAEILGKSCAGLSGSVYSDIGIVLDTCGVYERLSCLDNMMLFARFHGIDKKTVVHTLKQVGLTELKKPAGRLSKGMMQRLVLARAILHHPKVLFLDEPTSGLDPVTASQIHELLLSLKKEGTTIFLTTHNMEEASSLCDHIALLNEGTIIEYGEPDFLCRKYNKEHLINILCKDGSYLSLPNSPEHSTRFAELISAGIIETIHSSEPNLESVFITLTGRGFES